MNIQKIPPRDGFEQRLVSQEPTRIAVMAASGWSVRSVDVESHGLVLMERETKPIEVKSDAPADTDPPAKKAARKGKAGESEVTENA